MIKPFSVWSGTMLTGCALLLSACTTSNAQEARGIEAEDYYQITQYSQPQLSPDGRFVAVIQREVNDKKRGFDSNLWLYDRQNELTPRQFTYSNQDRSPLWAADGQSLLFSRGSALYTIRLHGGEAQEFLRLEQGSIGQYQWSPAGDELLLSIRLDPDISDPRSKAEDSEDSADLDHIRHTVYKGQGRYLDDSLVSLWRYQPDSDTLTALTLDSGFDEGQASYSPDGQRIVFASNRDENARDGAYSQSLFVWHNDSITELATGAGRASSPLWLDNTTLLYLHSAEPYAPTALKRYDISTNQPQTLADTLDIIPGNWLRISAEQVIVAADVKGSRILLQLDPASGDMQPWLGEGYAVGQVHGHHNGLVFTRERESDLVELYATDLNTSDPVRLSEQNQTLQQTLALGNYQRFTVTSEAHGFFLEPLNRQRGQQYPLILNIKGGPGGMWGHDFMQEMQLMAARGYAVVFVNYRGSSGFGQAFSDQVRLDYGGADYQDNMLALEHVLAEYDWIDQDRLYITGGSHGGFLTNWIITRTDRFRAAVTQRSVSNWISEAGTQAFPPASMQVEFGGTLWDNFDYYWGRSPLKYANQVTTPTLILHSTDDHITPIGQAEEWFYALRANDVEAELVVFRGEGHGLSRTGTPINLVERLERIVDWFDAHP